MAQKANYFISGVWKNSNEIITNIHVHEVGENNNFGIGKKMSTEKVINLIQKGYVFYTIIWDYPNWKLGAIVEVIQSVHGKYLRTKRDRSAKDNLDNLISMTIFNIQ